MKTLITFLLCLSLVGCVAPGGSLVPVTTAQTAADIVTPLIQGAVPIILNKNPAYAPAIAVVADSLVTVFASGNLSPTSIGAAIKLLNTKANLGLDVEVQTLLASVIASSVQVYKQRMGTQVVTATDPGIQILIQGLATGLRNGVDTWGAVRAGVAK